VVSEDPPHGTSVARTGARPRVAGPGPAYGAAVDVIPVIETERLVMRGWQEDDFDAYAEANADPEVQRFLGGPQEREESWRSFAVQIGHWHLRGYGQWALERRADGRLVLRDHEDEGSRVVIMAIDRPGAA
jgi:RimJ/RimL family protein N-acetyltransferase